MSDAKTDTSPMTDDAYEAFKCSLDLFDRLQPDRSRDDTGFKQPAAFAVETLDKLPASVHEVTSRHLTDLAHAFEDSHECSMIIKRGQSLSGSMKDQDGAVTHTFKPDTRCPNEFVADVIGSSPHRFSKIIVDGIRSQGDFSEEDGFKYLCSYGSFLAYGPYLSPPTCR